LPLTGNEPALRSSLQERKSNSGLNIVTIRAQLENSLQRLGIITLAAILAAACSLLAQSPGNAAGSLSHDPAVFQAYVRALLAAKDGVAISAAVESELHGQSDPERLRILARAALQLEQQQAAADAYRQLLQLKPEDAEALRWSGLLSFQKQRYEAARHFLARYLAQGEGDYESLFCYGEILWRAQDTSGARPYYKLALRQIEDTELRPFAMKLTHAHILSRLGHTREAIAAFENLIRQWPEDASLRADYASVLIDHRKHKEAQRVLAMP
jgi:tetratricopeptide (TPR) repeat protein